MTEDIVNHLKMVGIIKDKVNNEGGRMELLMLSGSHMYGFNSVDSDYDYRGYFTMQTGKIVGLEGTKDHIQFTEDKNDVDIMELRKFLGLCLKMNCNILEHLFSPALFQTTQTIELKEMIEQCLSKKGLYDSYKGMAVTNYKKFIFTGKRKTVKKYLYVFRALFAGIYALKYGKIEPNISELNKQFNSSVVHELIQDKIEGLENDIAKEKYSDIDNLVNDFIGRIDRAYTQSVLPEVVTREQYHQMSKWLKNIRRDNWDMLK